MCMKGFILGMILFISALSVFANKNNCSSKIIGHNVLVNSVFQFAVDKKKACFFAFYTENPEPMVDVKGNGNDGDAVWYGYYQVSSPEKIYEFPKPLDTGWANVCSIDAISFYDMNGDKQPDVTVIGSCNRNAIHYTFPFVFIWNGNKYVLNKNVYRTLYGFLSLTVADVRAYIKAPKLYIKVLERDNKL